MHTVEWGQTSSRSRQGVMCILNPDQVGAPGSRVLGHQALEAGFQLLVEVLGLAVRLRVISRRQTGCGTYEPAELPSEP